MGRTNPTFRDFLSSYEDDWAPYRRALRRQHEAHFDRLFEHAREYADAGGFVNVTDPEIAVLMSMLLGQQREIDALKREVDALKQEVESLRDDLPDDGAADGEERETPQRGACEERVGAVAAGGATASRDRTDAGDDSPPVTDR